MRVDGIEYPFCDDMEDSLSGNWNLPAPWGYTTEHAQTGIRSITDSPGTTYQNSINTSAMLSSSIDLTGADMPVLRFWQRYAMEANADYGYVEVSGNGGQTWTTTYFVTGINLNWKEERIDLSEYAQNPNVQIRFRLQTNASVRMDGWYIDDVCIEETSTPTLAFPFVDDMEGGGANWHSSSWELITDSSHSATHSMHDSPEGDRANVAGGFTYLTLAGTLDLTSVIQCPTLTFYERYFGSSSSSNFHVQISTNNGHDWTSLASYGGSRSNWTQRQIDLSPYAGAIVRLRFRSRLYGSDGWYIDDVRVEEGVCRRIDAAILEGPESIVVAAGEETPEITGRVRESGITDFPGVGAGIIAQLGYGPDASHPTESSWNWFTATYQSDAGGGLDDLYRATLIVPTEGVFDYAYRFRLEQESVWTYADLDANDLGLGGTNGYSVAQAGSLGVLGTPDIYIEPNALHFFFLNDSTVASRSVSIVNEGTGDLVFEIQESPGVSEIQTSGLGVARTERLGWRGGHGGVTRTGTRATALSNESVADRDETLSLAPSTGSYTLFDIPWLTEDPAAGVITPGDSVLVEVTFDGASAGSGSHSAFLVVISTDPDETPIVIPVTFEVATDTEENQGVPSRFALRMRGRNPIVGEATFRYALPVACHVKMDIFDVAGRRVAGVKDGPEGAGYGTVSWRTTRTSSGVYFYVFTAADFTQTGRIVVLK
jgi:hypothetical protein